MSFKNVKIITFLTVILLTIMFTGMVSATTVDDSNNTFTDNAQITTQPIVENQIIDDEIIEDVQKDQNNIYATKSIEKGNAKDTKTAPSTLTNYDELKNAVNDQTFSEEELILTLDGTFNIDENLVWGSSETTKTLTINGNGATIDGSNTYQFMTVNEGYTLNLNNLIIQNTLAENGSAIRNYGTLNVNNVTFKDNVAQKTTGKLAGGAAIYSEGTLNVEGNSHFIGNRIVGGVNGDGGAIYTNSAIYVKDTQFDSNIAEYTDADENSNGANGGAICVENSTSDMIIIDSTFTNNKGRHGGAINIFDKQGRNQGTKIITGSTFKGNKAIYGGAIEVYNNLTIEDSTFEDNSVQGVGSSNFNPKGGAICVNNLTDTGLVNLTVKNTTFSGNTAPQKAVSGSTLVGYGGAIYFSGLTSTIDNCTFIENSANKGGAFYCQDIDTSKGRHITITDSNFKTNEAMDGAAIFDQHYGSKIDQSTLTIDKSVFDGNNPTSTNYYGLSLNYDDLIITNTEITGIKPIRVAPSQRSSKYGYNVTINGLHNVTGIYTNYPVVSPTNYEELVLVSKEINNGYTGIEEVWINLVGTEYIETESIMLDKMPCTVTFNGSAKTIDANGQQFLTVGDGKKVTIRNMTIANAKAEKGAAIINYGTLTTQNTVIFENNEALYYGGAIYSNGTLDIKTTNFTNNRVSTIEGTTENDYGGAAICSLGKITVDRCNFTENVVAHNDVGTDGDGGFGGAISILNTTKAVDIKASNFTENGARHGGAISIKNNDKENTQKVTIDKNNFIENTALLGGAISTYQQVNITNSNFTKNTVKGESIYGKSQGGAIILNEGNGPYTARVTGNTFKENEAQEDGVSGVIHIQQDTTLNSSNNKYLDNKAGDSGVVNNYGNATFISDIFTGNNAKTGVLSQNGDDVTFTDCLFENNEGNGFGDLAFLFNDITITSSTINTDNLEELIAGGYNVIATDNIVNEETLSERLIKTTLTITPETTLLIDEDNIITATLIDATDVPVVGKEVNVVINGETVGTNKTDENGIVSYIYKPTEGTSATIKFTFTPDDYYIESESEEITVDLIARQATVIEYELINDIEGKVVLDIRVYEEETEDLITNAKIDLSGDVTATNVRTNKVYKNTELEAGEHTITATYNGLENVYKPSTLDITFTVIEDPSKLIEELKETIVTLNDTINNQASQISDMHDTINDQASQISDLNDAIQTMNSMIQDLQEQIDELKAAKNTTITFDEITDVKYNDNVIISGSLVNEENIGLFNQIITLTIGDEEINVTTKGGLFEYTTTAAQIGENTVTATYAGNDKNKESEATYTYEVAKADTTITITPIGAVKKGETVTVTGTLVDHNGNKLANSVVKLLINNGRKTLRTDADGVYTFDYTLTRIGENTINATYEGSDFYNEATESITVEVKPLATTIVIDPMDPVNKGTTASITGTLKDENGEAVANAIVKLTINGSQKTLTTDSEGKFTHTYTMGKLGENTITANFAGTASYEASETTATLEVTKAESVITLDSVESAVKGSNVTFTGKLTGADGVAIANAQVKITINGSPKTLKTDANGAFSHTFNMTKVGTNNITVVFNGNNYYLATETNATVEVTKAE